MSAPPAPIRPIALSIQNFRGWPGRHELSLEAGLTLLTGANGSGKSSLLNAIEWCLFGGEVAKKGCGIDERADWQVAHRGTRGTVEVALRFDAGGRTARLVRRRSSPAAAREEDAVRLELAGDEVLEGYEVADWMAWNALPDWPTWTRAFCQHQERLRGRVLDSSERSAQLAVLLGLEEYAETHQRLKDLKAAALARAAQDELASIESDLDRAMAAPQRELRELEERLEQRGLARAEVDEPRIAELSTRLAGEGVRIAERLELGAAVPATENATAEEVLRWARGWEPVVGRRRAELERELGTLRLDLQRLEVGTAGLEPARTRQRDAAAAHASWTAEHGTAEALERQVEALQREREELRDEAERRDARSSLWRAARELLRREGEAACPVCGHADPSLEESLRRRLESVDDPLGEPLARLEERERRLREQLDELARLRTELERAEGALASVRREVEAQLPGTGAAPDRAAEERRRSLRVLVDHGEDLLRGVDEHLALHRSDSEVLEILLKWRATRVRAEAATGDLARLGAWSELQDAIDEAAGLVADLEVLGGMARRVQEERSAERVAEVNAALAAHCARIGGIAGGEAVRVEVKTTATRLAYRLVDSSGDDLTPILNQAALNSLSFALLFSQAEDRAGKGLPAWLVLDDPGQSLDGDRLAGLAAAVSGMASRVPVLLATPPGVLSETLERAGPPGLRRYRIITGPDGRGERVEEVRP